MTDPGACDPLSDARAEVEALLRALGVADPMEKLRPVFAKVRQRWGGERVHIARLDPADRAERERAIREGIAAGMPAKTVAAKTGLHPATVRRARRDWAI